MIGGCETKSTAAEMGSSSRKLAWAMVLLMTSVAALGVSAVADDDNKAAIEITTSALNMTVDGDPAVDPSATARFCSRAGEPVSGTLSIVLGEDATFASAFNGTRWCSDEKWTRKVYEVIVPVSRFEHRMCAQVAVIFSDVSMIITGKLPKGLEHSGTTPKASDLDWRGFEFLFFSSFALVPTPSFFFKPHSFVSIPRGASSDFWGTPFSVTLKPRLEALNNAQKFSFHPSHKNKQVAQHPRRPEMGPTAPDPAAAPVF